MNMNMMNMC